MLRRDNPVRRRTGTAALLALLTLFSISCRDVNVLTHSFATLDEAAAEGAVDRGWLPKGLPPGVREIRTAHDEDSPRRWGLFNFTPADADGLKVLLGDEMSLDGVRCDPPRRIEWWPVLLRGALMDEQVRATGVIPYRSRDGGYIFVVNWKQGRAYYWTP